MESISQLLTRLLSISQVAKALSPVGSFGVVPVRKPDLFLAPICISMSWDHRGWFVSSSIIPVGKEELSWRVWMKLGVPWGIMDVF